MMDNIFGTDGLDDVDRHLYSSSEFNLMEYHDMLNADDINNDFLDYASVQNVLTDFSPSDINLELLTGELLPPETYESQQENSTRQQQQNHGNGEPSLLDADLFSPDFLDMLDFDSRRQFTKDPLFYKTYPSQRSNDNDELNQKTDFYNDCKPSTSNEQPYYQQQEQKQQQQRDEFNPYLGPIYDDVTKSELADFRDMEAKFAFDDILLGSSGSTKTKHDIAGERMTEEDEDLGDVDEDENADDALASDTDDDDDENAENKAPATAGAQQKQPQRRRDDTRKDYAKRIEEPQMAGGYVKPSYSYSCLITLALKNSGNGELTVSEIYAFLCEHFPYFRAAPSGWKNSVRHNLSLNKSFQKIEVETPGCHGRKSCLWRLNPNKVIKMEQELRKWRDRSEALILSAMHNSSAANLDAIQSGQMGMPATVQRRASVNNLLVSRLNSSSSGYPTSMMSLPYADSMQKCSVGKNFQPRVMGQSLPAGSSLNSMSTSHQQLVQHQPKMLQRVMAANASGIGCDIDELDGTSTTSSSSASCSPSVSRRQSSPMTSRMRLDSLGAENGENYGVNDTTNGTNKEGGSAESLHKAAARKLDFLLQQKSATIFNPSKELFTSPNALTAVTSTPPNRRLLLNAAGTPTRSPLSTLSMNTESSALKSRRRCETPMSPSMKRLTSGTTVGYSVLINRQTTDLASKVGTIEHANEADVLETKRFRNAADASSHGSAVKLERQQQDLRSPYRVGFSSFGEFSDENSSPQQNKEQQFKQLQKQHQQQRNRDTVNGQLVGELNTRSPFRQLNNQNNNNQNKAGSTRSYQISSASLRLGEASNLSPSRKTLIKERRHYFGAMPQQIQQKRLPEQDLQQHEKQQHSYNQQRLEQQKQRQYDKQREVSDQYQLGENQNVSSADVRPTMETNGRTAVAKASVFHSAMDAIHKNRLF